jgi:hypothetical protein
MIADFAGDTPQTARNLGSLGAFLDVKDFITSAPPADVDYYKFSLASAQTFTASLLQDFGSNANLSLTLYQDSGGVLTQLQQASGSSRGLVLQRNLSAGNYQLRLASSSGQTNYELGLSTGDNDDSIPEALLSINNQMIVGSSRNFTLSSASDVDMILLNLDATGDTSFAIDLDSSNGSNVDTYLRLFDPSGNQLASNDDGAAPGEAASKFSFLTFTLPANYNSDFVFVGVSAAANKNYNAVTGSGDAGGNSSGAYTLNITKFTPPLNGSISGNVYNDVDGNGVKGTLETGIAGRTVYIDANNNSILDGGEKSAITNSSGVYTISGLVAGTYKVRQIRPTGWSQTLPLNNFGLNVTLSSGQNSLNNNFFIRPTPAGTASIAGNVFHDFNRNTIKDAGDTGLAGWVLYIDLDNDKILDTNEQRVLTDSSGNYIFSNLAAGTYKVRAVIQSGFVQTFPLNGFGIGVTLASGQHAVNQNFGVDN